MNNKQEHKSIFKPKNAAGKGDKPRNISQSFYKNYEEIDWSAHKKNKNSEEKI
jgi:hypothetical protein